MSKIFFTTIFLTALIISADEKRIESVFFKTVTPPPAFIPPKSLAPMYKIFKTINSQENECGTVAIAITASYSLGVKLKQEQMGNLLKHINTAYKEIASDPEFKGIKSALPYCFSDNKHSKGHCFIYLPGKITDQTKSIIFLHGYGGNFLFYLWVLKEIFPDSIILTPSWSSSWKTGKMNYLKNMVSEIQKQFSIKIRKPLLIAISAGGPTGFRIYNNNPNHFSGYVSIASSPNASTAKKLKKDLKILMLNSKQDKRFPIEKVKARLSQSPTFKFVEIDGDHFFFLTQRNKCGKIIKDFLADN
jgi:pimeloyl-ACP methyl ester carboxylesterase